jgi:DNA mismatch repair protein MutL
VTPRIRILPPELADQIAAGEVVERPASVVKELCENSIDAGARRIDVEVERGGRRLIRVGDDGSGMTREEAHLALLRHATSKLRDAAELASLRTMGFRGEALPSIAAVSRLSLTTRARGEISGWRIDVEGGMEKEPREVGAPEGTAVEVRDLLWNVPARLKFLKSEPTEAAHITEALERLALAFPEVHFKLRQNGRVAVDLPPHASALERARAALFRDLFVAEGEEGGHGVTALLAAPSESQASGRGLYLYVDRRFVRDRGLGHAVLMGYGELIERGRWPVAVLLFAPRAGSVDVNVHPQKVEVRFERPQEVYAAVRHVIARAIAKAPWLETKPAAVRVYSMPPIDDAYRAHVREAAAQYNALSPRGVESAHPSLIQQPAPRPQGFFAQLRYIGQFAETYLVCEAEGELVLIDQHAAHERVQFARLREAHAKCQLGRQRLLFPVVLQMVSAEVAAASEHRATLDTLGFDLEPFGADSLAVKAVPEAAAGAEPEKLLRDVLAELGAHGASEVVPTKVDHVLATMACHAVVRAGDVLGEAQARALLDAMDGVDLRGHCPHGRPVVLRLPQGELERRFGRI